MGAICKMDFLLAWNFIYTMNSRIALLVILSTIFLTPAQSPRTEAPPVFTNSIGQKFALIPAGEFMMGSTEEESRLMLEQMKKKGVHEWYQASPPSENPRHAVRISRAFYLGAHEVTLGAFRAFIEASGYRTDAEKDGKGADGKFDGKWTTRPEFNWKSMGYERSDGMPVVNVTWNDAVAFCEWLTRKEGRIYRLPTEAEWEFACRAGTTTRYYWGEDESRRDEYVWHGRNSGGGPHPVGQLKPNAFGLFDMCGNAYEYCSDWFGTNYYATVAARVNSRKNGVGGAIDPKGPESGTEKVVRSGSWGTDPMHCRSAFRGGAGLTHRNMRDGFRVVCETR